MIPLALWHGFTGRGAVWETVREHLDFLCGAGAFDVWAPDLPGHGPEADLPVGTTFEATVDDLADAMATRFGGPAEVVGYSLGARLALALAVRHPRQVRRLTLIGVRAGIDESERPDRRRDDNARADAILEHGVDAFIDRWRQLPHFATQQNLPSIERDTHDRRRRSHGARGLAAAVRILSPGRMPDYRPRVGTLNIPVDVVVGELDKHFLPLARELVLDAGDGRLRVVSGVGHDVVLESPSSVAEVVADRGRVRSAA